MGLRVMDEEEGDGSKDVRDGDPGEEARDGDDDEAEEEEKEEEEEDAIDDAMLGDGKMIPPFVRNSLIYL